LLTQGAFELDRQHGTVAAVRFRPRAYWPLAIVRATGTARSEILDQIHATIREAARDLARSGAWPCVLIDR
ncbi:MAG TPA: hypothetical protein VJK90_13075, partial [Acetobacteraceae bacterium]|nr:hypothetical protein [Acetobacteraceae bacterium]